ncbi:hypothetical protein [Paenibacillus gorillae]|uniref:hypothetical protein n=1 Tax=Paenibacillus gorillae TaxID=1243662 RepID=UPI0004BB1904|nr:hypothetical protein [Paenibacillus gorillae]
MDELRKSEGFQEEKLFVLPAYHIEELSRYELTRGLFVSDIGFFPPGPIPLPGTAGGLRRPYFHLLPAWRGLA